MAPEATPPLLICRHFDLQEVCHKSPKIIIFRQNVGILHRGCH